METVAVAPNNSPKSTKEFNNLHPAPLINVSSKAVDQSEKL